MVPFTSIEGCIHRVLDTLQPTKLVGVAPELGSGSVQGTDIDSVQAVRRQTLQTRRPGQLLSAGLQNNHVAGLLRIAEGGGNIGPRAGTGRKDEVGGHILARSSGFGATVTEQFVTRRISRQHLSLVIHDEGGVRRPTDREGEQLHC